MKVRLDGEEGRLAADWDRATPRVVDLRWVPAWVFALGAAIFMLIVIGLGLLLGAALIAIFPAHAAVGDAPTDCTTIASDLKAIKDAGLPIQTTVYQGMAARQVLAVLAELNAPEQEIWGTAQSVMLMIGTPNADPPAMLKMFGADGCAFYALGTDLNGVHAILAKLGTSA